MGKVIGIDLGTTNSVVAFIEATTPVVVSHSDGLRTIPSIVAYTKNEELLVGQIAKRQKVINAENTFFSVKRFIGASYDEIDKEDLDVPYEIKRTGDSVKINCTNLKTFFSPEEISAQIIREITKSAESYIRQDVSETVITVPAYFNDSQRRATKDAGTIGGLNVLRIINEPTAASLAYGLDKFENQRILVFDLGGGTFDVSILEVGNGIFEVLSTSGDTHLGGDHFDQKLVEFLLKDFEDNNGTNLKDDVYAIQRITEAAEKAKISLSTLEEVLINIPFISVKKEEIKHIEKNITREFFDSLCVDIIDRCREPIQTALKDARLTGEDINNVVMVGGSTRIPAINRLIKSIANTKIYSTINPDEVVAIGAAIQGGIITGEIRDLLLLDVTPLSLGIETMGEIMTTMIPRNTTVPTRKFETFSTAEDNQPEVTIHILQGERSFAIDNKSLGKFRLKEIPLAPKGVPEIKVSFDLDNNNLLRVTAENKLNGTTESLTVDNSSCLSDKEVEKIIKDAEKFAMDDSEKTKVVNLKNEANSMIYATKKILNDKEKELPEKLKEELKSGADKLKENITNSQFKDLESNMEKLNSSLSEAYEKINQKQEVPVENEIVEPVASAKVKNSKGGN